MFAQALTVIRLTFSNCVVARCRTFGRQKSTSKEPPHIHLRPFPQILSRRTSIEKIMINGVALHTRTYFRRQS